MTNIFVAKLDYGITQEQLKSSFEQYGRVNKVTIATDKETGRSKGFAFIEMQNDEEAQQAISALNGSSMNGREIAVKKADDRSSDNRPKRDFSKDNRENSPRPYQRNNSEQPSHSKQEYKSQDKESSGKADYSAPSVPVTDFENPKGDGRKKDDKFKKKEGKPKSHKMEAYKKSGKQQRYTDFDDDESDYDFKY